MSAKLKQGQMGRCCEGGWRPKDGHCEACPEWKTPHPKYQEAVNKVCIDGHLNEALDSVIGSHSPDGTFCVLGALAEKAIEIALDLAALDRATPAVPVGFRLVPVEPTPEMIEAGADVRIEYENDDHGFGMSNANNPIRAELIFSAMLAAAPLPSSTEQAIPIPDFLRNQENLARERGQRRVVCAANAYKDLIVIGARHFDSTMHKQIAQFDKCGLIKPSAWEQGFIDQWGVFMTREEAFIVATNAGQIRHRVGGDNGTLYSENLY